MEDKTNITKFTLYYKGVQVIKVYPEEMKADELEKKIDFYLGRSGWKPSWSEDTNKQVDPDWVNEENLGTCAKCGAPNLKSQKGNLYCSKKCWLK